MATCDSTWHQSVDTDGDVMWFSLAGRLGDEQGTYIYWYGDEPDESACSKIWVRDGKPWTCSVCGTVLSAEKYRPPKRVRESS